MELKDGAHNFSIRRIMIDLNEHFQTLFYQPQVVISENFHVGPKFFDPLERIREPPVY